MSSLKLGSRIISWRKPEHFKNCDHFNNQLRLIICGSSGSGKTSVLYNLLLDTCPVHKIPFLDYDFLVLVNHSLNQNVYKIIISGYQAGLGREHLRRLFDLQDKLTDVEAAIKTLQYGLVQNRFKLSKIKVKPTRIKDSVASFLVTKCKAYILPSDLPPVEEFNPKREKKVLLVMDDSMCLDLTNVEDYF